MKKKAKKSSAPVDPRSKRHRLARIEGNPAAYQLCEGCESVVSVRVDICPLCHAYRFDRDARRVIAAARRLAKAKGDELPLSE